jgi:transcriptional regulator with XRE-family HTH domain
MSTSQEKTAFSKRLEAEIARKNVKGATQLANAFNDLRPDEPPVSAQTTHKWLSGRTIPTPDKLQVLADWLNVPLHWLHYGPPPDTKAKALARGEKYPEPTPELIELASKIGGMEPKFRDVVEELVEMYYNVGKK